MSTPPAKTAAQARSTCTHTTTPTATSSMSAAATPTTAATPSSPQSPARKKSRRGGSKTKTSATSPSIRQTASSSFLFVPAKKKREPKLPQLNSVLPPRRPQRTIRNMMHKLKVSSEVNSSAHKEAGSASNDRTSTSSTASVTCSSTGQEAGSDHNSQNLNSPPSIPAITSVETSTRNRNLVEFMQSHFNVFVLNQLSNLDTAEQIITLVEPIQKRALSRDHELQHALANLSACPDCPASCTEFLVNHLNEFPLEILKANSQSLTAFATSLETKHQFVDNAIRSISIDNSISKEDRKHVITFMKDYKHIIVQQTEMLPDNNIQLVQIVKDVWEPQITDLLALVISKAKVLMASVPPQALRESDDPGKFYLDVSSAEAICTCMGNLAPYFMRIGLKLKSEPHANKLVEAVVFPDFVDRDTPLQTVRNWLMERFVPRIPSDKRTMNPLVFVFGAPGSGKSRALDELVNMFEAPNNPLAPPTTSSSEPSQVGNIFCITITWNGNTPFNPLVDASGDGLPGLFLRILFSHWFDGIGLVKFASHIQNWEAIVAQISSTDGELLERLFDAIHLHSKKRHALLCVDEILMSNSSSKSEEHSIAICKQLGNLLDKHRATSEDPNASVLMVLFSCLDKGWAKELKTHSGRQILFSQMDPIQFRLCVKLFEQHFLRFGEQAKAGLMTLLMDTGGIPCLLASAEQWLRNDKTALQWLAGRSYSLTSIIDGTRAGCFDDDTLEIVSAVVCARDVNPLTLIGETSFSRLISRGHLYCLGHKPCTSVITLLQFASEHNAPPVHTFEDVITLLDDNSGKTLEQVSILLNFILNPTVSWASGQALEDFCTLHPFLLTLCNAKEGDRTFTVCSMFGSPKFRRCVEAVVGEMAVFPRIPHFLCWNVPYEGQSHHFYWWAKNHVNLLRLGSVVRCCHNNPGFETVFLLASACTKDKFIICLEAKYSEEKSTSTLSAEDIVDKWRNTQDQIQPLLQTTAWGGSTVILMIVALRQLPKTLNFQLPPDANIVIVDRQQFVKYLGPTIGRRFESADQVQFEDFIYRETTTASHS